MFRPRSLPYRYIMTKEPFEPVSAAVKANALVLQY